MPGISKQHRGPEVANQGSQPLADPEQSGTKFRNVEEDMQRSGEVEESISRLKKWAAAGHRVEATIIGNALNFHGGRFARSRDSG